MTPNELMYHAYNVSKLVRGSIEETERYAHGKWMRKYGFAPSWMPLFIHYYHGVTFYDNTPMHMVKSPFRYKAFMGSYTASKFALETGEPKRVILSPFVYYRKSKGILRSADAIGSLWFHAHSTFWTETKNNTNDIIYMLQRLPNEMQPVSIMMHFVDVQRGLQMPYIEAGFSVYTAGEWHSTDFIENFYEILRHHKYALSNEVGSYSMYATEMGVPFSLIGDKPVRENCDDPNFAYVMGKTRLNMYRKMFNGIHMRVNKRMKVACQYELGILESNRLSTAVLIYKSYFEHKINQLWEYLTHRLKIGKAPTKGAKT